jgi:autophagy-related protein 9
MLNPMGMSRAYTGYTRANQSLVEEEEDCDKDGEERDVEAQRGQSTIFQSHARGQRASWDAKDGVSEMSALRPNIQQEDRIHEQESSDDEVPQDFMIEAQTTRNASSDGDGRSKGKERANPRPHALTSTPSGRTLPPISHTKSAAHPQYVPSQPSGDQKSAPSSPRPRQPQGPGLNAYERALWNWVNVYNLDAFLQEVYYYYQGKGIYSIALARGLNLLFVHPFELSTVVHVDKSMQYHPQYSRVRDWLLYLPPWMR